MPISQSAVKVILQEIWTRTPTRTRTSTRTLDPHPHNSTRYPQPATFNQTRFNGNDFIDSLFGDFFTRICFPLDFHCITW